LLVEHWTEALRLSNERKLDAALIELRAFETVGVECVRALSYASPGLPLMGLVDRTQRVDEVNLSLLDALLMKPLDVDALEKAFDFARDVRSSAFGVSSEVRLRSAAGAHRFMRELRKQA
jgi:DNA-binding response OmpR family regulator